MAVIAIASSLIAYRIYRSSNDPNVIVYVDPDPRRPSIINLVIANVGQGPAKSVRFETSSSLPSEAYGLENPPMPTPMETGCIISGIPYLAPSQKFVVTWGQYAGLEKFLNGKIVEVTSHYENANSSFFRRRLHSSSLLDIRAMQNLDASDHNWGNKVVKQLEAMNKVLSKIEQHASNSQEKS